MIIQQSQGHIVRQIQEGLWQVTFYFPASTNCWLFQDKDGLTLVDAANSWNSIAILSIIKMLGQDLQRIIITHAHPDHAGAAAELARCTGAVVYVHEEDRIFLEGKASMADSPGFWICRSILQAGQVMGFLNPPRVDGLVSINDGDMIGNLLVIHTPGHTPGSVSLWSEQAGAIFCGDNVISVFNTLYRGMPWFTLDFKTQTRSLEKYSSLPARMLLSGHGPVFRRDNLSRELLRLIGR